MNDPKQLVEESPVNKLMIRLGKKIFHDNRLQIIKLVTILIIIILNISIIHDCIIHVSNNTMKLEKK